MQSHQSSFGSDAIKNRGHRRSDTLGKAMPITSLLLNYAPSSSENIRSDAGGSRSGEHGNISPTQQERPPRFFPIRDTSSPGRECTKSQTGQDTDDDLDMLDQEYEILISECSSSIGESDRDDGDRRKSNSEEYISLIGNSKFYAPCLTCVGSAPSDLAAQPTAINEMCRRLCTEECRLRLSLAGLVTSPLETVKQNRDMLAKYVHETLDTPPQLPPRPDKAKRLQDMPPAVPKRPPASVAIQRKKFLSEILRPNELDSSDDDEEWLDKQRPPKELLDIVSSIVMPQQLPLAPGTGSLLPTHTTTGAEEPTTAQIVDPHEVAMLKDFREKFEIAEALAKTSAMTSTSQIKQRLAARKLEIELDNANAMSSDDDETAAAAAPHASSHSDNHETGLPQSQPQRQQLAQGVPATGNDAVTAATTLTSLTQKHPDTKTSSPLSSGYHEREYEPPRELLLYLVRMGSFNSAPKINNIDSQDDGLELPKGLSTPELLQHVKHLRGDQQPPLLARFFLKPVPSLISADITDGLRCLKLNSVSRVCSAPISDPHHLRLLQWNLLSQTLGQNNDGFVRCPDEALTWENRKFLIVQEILQNNPDIVCLQEVDHFKFLQNILGTQNYEGIFFPKPDSPCLYIEENNGPDGCAIFYKRDKFDLRNFDTRILEVWRVQSNQVAIAVNLAVKATGREVCVCTTHLKARHGSLLSKLRNEQGRDLIRFVKQFAGDRPLLLCGDFNAEPTEPVYSTMLNCEFLQLSSAYSDMRAESDECNNESTKDQMKGCDKVQKSIENEPPYTTWKIREDGEECHTIDYVFYTKDHLKIKNCLEFPQGDEIGQNRTPSFQYPSDHFSLICDFEILDNDSNQISAEKTKTQ